MVPLSAQSYSCVFLFSCHPQLSKQESLGYIIGQLPQDFAFPYDPQLTPILQKKHNVVEQFL